MGQYIEEILTKDGAKQINYDALANRPIQRIVSEDTEQLGILRYLESGVYVLSGRFRPYAGATTVALFTNDMLVNVNRKEDKSWFQVFSPANNAVQHLEITDDSYTLNTTRMGDFEKIALEVVAKAEEATIGINEHPPTPGPNGTWLVWDVISQTYTESDVPLPEGNTVWFTEQTLKKDQQIQAQRNIGLGHYVTPKMYGAKGDGVTDDTAAFKEALENNRVVYVPGGTYILSDTIKIRENSELELSQDVVLKFIQTTGNAVVLSRCGSLRGNHATIIVPYTFDGNVIYSSSAEDGTDIYGVPPWTRWDPQWKNGRYVTDINITKPNDSGFHYSDDGTCYGTAVYLNADGSQTQTFFWGINMSGLRIAGGFKYGIRAYNENKGWNHDMRIEAVIDSCEVGASLENCNNAHLAVTVQPRKAFDETPYAKWGIRLVNSQNANLSESAVWDWGLPNAMKTGDASVCEYQHIAMYGNCAGAIIRDMQMVSSLSFWQTVYYDDVASMLTASVTGPKGNIPPDPKYAFYKNYRQGNYEFNNRNLSWRDGHNMVRYDVPVLPKNATLNPNHVYKIGHFTIGSDAENPVGAIPDELAAETITIEENSQHGLTGWSNLYYADGAIRHYWQPLSCVYDNRVPIYLYSVENGTYTICRLIRDGYDIQHVYNCRISITNARRFLFDFASVGSIDELDPSVYMLIQPQTMAFGQDVVLPTTMGLFSVNSGKPVVCTKSAVFANNGVESKAAEVKTLATEDDLKTLTDGFAVAEDYFTNPPAFTNRIGAYKENTNIDVDTGEEKETVGNILTEKFSVSGGDVVRFKGVTRGAWPDFLAMYHWQKDGTFRKGYLMRNWFASSDSYEHESGVFSYDDTTNTLTWSVNHEWANAYDFCLTGTLAEGYNFDDVILTINEEIRYADTPMLKPSVKVGEESLPNVFAVEADYFEQGAPAFTNRIGAYKENVYLDVETGEEKDGVGNILTEKFSVSGGDVVRFKGVTRGAWPDFIAMYHWQKDGTFRKGYLMRNWFASSDSYEHESGVFSYDDATNTLTWSVNHEWANAYDFCLTGTLAEGYGFDDVILTISEEIIYLDTPVLKPTVKITEDSMPAGYVSESKVIELINAAIAEALSANNE